MVKKKKITVYKNMKENKKPPFFPFFTLFFRGKHFDNFSNYFLFCLSQQVQMFYITSISELICLKIINIFWMIEFNKKSLPVLISIIKIGFQVIITNMKAKHHILLTFTFVFVFFLPRTVQFPQKMTCLSTPISQRALISRAVQSVYFLPLPNNFYLRIRPVLGYSLSVLYFLLCLSLQMIF